MMLMCDEKMMYVRFFENMLFGCFRLYLSQHAHGSRYNGHACSAEQIGQKQLGHYLTHGKGACGFDDLVEAESFGVHLLYVLTVDGVFEDVNETLYETAVVEPLEIDKLAEGGKKGRKETCRPCVPKAVDKREWPVTDAHVSDHAGTLDYREEGTHVAKQAQCGVGECGSDKNETGQPHRTYHKTSA